MPKSLVRIVLKALSRGLPERYQRAASLQKAVLGQVNKDFPEWTSYIEQIRSVK